MAAAVVRRAGTAPLLAAVLFALAAVAPLVSSHSREWVIVLWLIALPPVLVTVIVHLRARLAPDRSVRRLDTLILADVLALCAMVLAYTNFWLWFFVAAWFVWVMAVMLLAPAWADPRPSDDGWAKFIGLCIGALAVVVPALALGDELHASWLVAIGMLFLFVPLDVLRRRGRRYRATISPR
ncbi:MAG TPA: hypothetical protein VMS14_03020 [Ilumatobacteraceae bacterium]|nr:hypothetical protein [Ilumatobacteraceae bacterium]HUC32346.1 hypothetical protein [Ilumatobacteraceae bacterium]